ncbi:MAG: tetratricopeptide repeat protein [Candidatus Thiothrix putei]|uniref:Tetratricopeptide repeat protein n=1 Tax=Candidatus Thiothrix putei TaxID=3080811 RepID=A0AA95HDC7_9GAMM|nr:MAG: tetratricopeptide repeat protein [Candidatus Thiothrix putei]
MPSTRLPRRFVSLSLALLIGGCTLGNTPLADQSVSNVATFSSPLSYQVYNILAGEMFVKQGNVSQAALHYVAAAQQTNDPAIAQRAVELAMSAEDTSLAGRALERWITLSPDSSEAVQYQALANLRTEKYDEAVKDLVKIRDRADKENEHGFAFIVSLLALEPDATKSYETFKRYVNSVDSSPRAQLALASLALNADQFEAALQASQVAQQKGNAAEKVQAARWAAKALVGLDKLPDAITALEAVNKNTKDTELKLDYGRLLILADRRTEATPIYQQLYTSFPDNPDILYTLGLLHLEQKSFTAAEPLISKLLTVPDRAAEANYFMGQIHEGLQRPKPAIEVYKKAVGGKYDREATVRVARLLVETSNLASAREWVAEQVKIAADNERKGLLLQLDGQLLHDQGQYAEAINSFGKALDVKANDPDVLYSRALSAEKLGDFSKAEADLQEVLKSQPDNTTVLNALGYMLAVNTQRYSEASGLITKALAGRPDDPAIMDSMGWVLYLTGKPEDAETWLRKAYTQLQDPEVASHLIEVLAVRGNKAEAQAILDTMLSKFPDDNLLLKVKEKLVGL